MTPAIEILQLVTPLILLLPLLHLTLPPKSPSSEIPGIRAIKIRIITPRRGLVLTLLSALAFTSFLDAVIFVAGALIPPHRDAPHTQFQLATTIINALGGFLIWGLTAIVVEWRTKWGDGALALLTFLGFGLEIGQLPLVILRAIHSGKLALSVV